MTEPLLDWRAWAFIVFISAVSLVGSFAKYKIGQAGMPKVKEHLPQVSPERWDRVEGWFQRWGAPTLLLGGIPGLGTLLPPLAGAHGIKMATFLFYMFLGKFVRNWLIFYPLFLGALKVAKSRG